MPLVTRISDLDITHCSPMVRAEGSPTVFVAGLPVSFEGCVNTVHRKPGGISCIPHAMPITLGSLTVRVHGFGIGRVGDAITDCTFVAQGWATVVAGG